MARKCVSALSASILQYEWEVLYFLLFFAKIRKISYSHNAENSIGNNSSSVEDRAVKFMYSGVGGFGHG